MKHITLYLLTGIAIVMGGCNANLLDTSPDNKYVESNFWETEAAANAALTGTYAVLRYEGLFGGSATPLWEEGASPNAFCYSGGTAGFDAIGRSQQSASTGGIINSRWNHCYQGIGRANTFLERINEVDMNEDLQSRMEGEAYFLRAMYYYVLETYYGDVPLILASPDPATQKDLPRTTREEVVKQVLADLAIAAERLPMKYSGGDVGRATKGAALALKARILLYEASPLFNESNDQSRWQAAADAAKAVIDLAPEAGYGLYENYRELFLPENENNKEVIFDVQFIFPDEGNSFDLIGSQYNTNAPLLDLAEAYEMKNGLPITDPASGYDETKPYENRDPRLYGTIVYPGDTYKGEPVVGGAFFKQTGYAMKKYTIYDKEVPPTDKASLKAGQSETNFIVLRYADILMMYAEALNEVSPGSSAILTSLNLVRDRVGMPTISAASQPEMREIIHHERRVEFAGEALYYNDIRRWKIAESVMNAPIKDWKHATLETRKFDKAKDYWWPIPQGELDLNPNLEQNPGY